MYTSLSVQASVFTSYLDIIVYVFQVGYSRASDVSGVWWSRVFDRVASSITVENKEVKTIVMCFECSRWTALLITCMNR